MTMRTNQVLSQQKGRLAGFFLLLLSACQPTETVVPGALEFAKAQQAIEAQLPIKAAEHLALAIQQGHPDASVQWLQLTQSEQGPLQQYRQLQQWRPQPPDAEVAALLGLWQQQGLTTPQLVPEPVTSQCQLNIQPVLTSASAISHWQRFRLEWPTSAFATLPLCFLPPAFIDSRSLRCSETTASRIHCDAQVLQNVVSSGRAQLLVVVGGRGNASFNNGWLQLAENFTPALFRHEFSHALGFLDEYALPASVAKAECQRTDLTPNILFSAADLPRYADNWQLAGEQLRLTPVATCNLVNRQAYRVIETDSHMQHFELPVPALYIKLMQQQLQQPQRIMPVQYYFAALARQRQDMVSWQQLMQQAAAFGYPAAQDGLTAAGFSLTAR
ncbi:MAG: hypothetical protein U5L02_11925 [Rheinheimera sp.]|nr:hypothetical protein [Rheinheimera sp.]